MTGYTEVTRRFPLSAGWMRACTGWSSRHSSFRRAVCVDARVRIRAGGRSAMGAPTATQSGRRVRRRNAGPFDSRLH